MSTFLKANGRVFKLDAQFKQDYPELTRITALLPVEQPILTEAANLPRLGPNSG